MSWLFGIIKSGQNHSIENEYEKYHPEAMYTLSSENLYVALGGIEETCFYEAQNESRDIGWAVLGLGIKVIDSRSRILNKNDWEKIFSSGTIQTDTLDGHFVALRWKKDELELFTDQLGLRTAYYGRCDEGMCFSTRLDWVAQKTKLHEMNLDSLGGRWLLFNQLSYESCVNGVERLGPSSHLVIKKGIVTTHENRPWTPEFGSDGSDKAQSVLDSLVQAATNSDRTVSLGLSGGFDSRTLLSILTANRDANFNVHTFGEPSDPDVQISEDIARELLLKRQYFNDPVPNSETLISFVKSFVAQNVLVEPASSILRLRYYPQQYKNGQIVIDGGFGEIARRQYLNRIVRFGRNALQKRDIGKVFKLLRTMRADIFNYEYSKELQSAASRSIETTLQAMPLVHEIGIENFADLLSVRTRVPNFGEPEQTRSDAYIMNFMPLVQPSFLRAVFNTDLKWRRNGGLYKEIIQKKEPRLKNFPLIKSGITYRFGLSSSAAWFVTNVKNKISKPYRDSMPDRFLFQLHDFVLDLAHSSGFRNWSGYNQNKILYSIDTYYKGDKLQRNTVHWWLTFELWRRSLSN
jgi:hypothetical protein